jgi:hypothetical protein
MFVAIFNWMLSITPGIMRPAVNWLLGGLRKITGYISWLWNSVGNAIGNLLGVFAAVRQHIINFAVTVVYGLLWIRFVWVPAKVNEATSWFTRWVGDVIARVRNEIVEAVQAVSHWVQWAIGEVRVLISNVIDWARDQLARIDAFISMLVRALMHVLSGPEVLAEWLAAAMLKALGRYVFSQRDRFFNWMLRGSISFTGWIAGVVEDMIVRML